jgi:four helix bundle protein
MERERLGSFEQMKVWQEAHQLVLKVLDVTPGLPPEQQDGIALAMEKTAIEVPKTIAEGFKRRGSRNKAHYYNVAQSHLEALRYFFILCRDLKYPIDFDDLSYRSDTVARMLDSLVRSMSRQEGGGGGDRGRRGRGGRRGGRGQRPDGMGPGGPDGGPDGDFNHGGGDDGFDDAPDRSEVSDSDIGTGD